MKGCTPWVPVMYLLVQDVLYTSPTSDVPALDDLIAYQNCCIFETAWRIGFFTNVFILYFFFMILRLVVLLNVHIMGGSCSLPPPITSITTFYIFSFVSNTQTLIILHQWRYEDCDVLVTYDNRGSLCSTWVVCTDCDIPHDPHITS